MELPISCLCFIERMFSLNEVKYDVYGLLNRIIAFTYLIRKGYVCFYFLVMNR